MQCILVFNNHRTNKSLTSTYLEKAGFHVLVTYDREMTFQFLHQRHPDLLIFDLIRPDRDDWDFILAIRDNRSLADIPVVLIAALASERDKIFGLENGVDDFIIKPECSRLVIARVKALLRRCSSRKTASPQVLHTANMVLDSGRFELRVDGELVDLTQAEFGIIWTLMGKPGYVFSRDELVENALGSAQEGAGRTLDTHIKNLRRKIEADPRKPVHIQTVYGVGYKLMAD